MTLTEALLWPFSLLYGAATHLRARAYRKGLLKPKHLDGLVISVGNITVGGTGKTPMVLWIAEHLIAEGQSAGILTRGFKGKPITPREARGRKESSKAAMRTSAEHKQSSLYASTSDEVRLLQSRLGDCAQFGVGANRYANGRLLRARGVDWFILDDGFQHLQLARDVDIVLIDASTPFGGGRLLPSGRLREWRSALARADIIVITRSDHNPAVEAAIRHESEAPIFYARPKLDGIFSFSEGLIAGDVAPAATGKLLAFCAIGNPQAFISDLRKWGIEIVGHKFYADHHRFTDRDDEVILEAAKAAGATGLICTEKDLYNLHAIYYGEMPVFYCSISMEIDREDELWRTIQALAKSRGKSTAAR
ncbi:MAG: tetraacyldisaccharide 4'-kinase [Candidatus Acidiferrales bacterium]